MTVLLTMTCRHCGTRNPMVFFAPAIMDETSGTCLCFDCVKRRNWLTLEGNLRPEVAL